MGTVQGRPTRKPTSRPTSSSGAKVEFVRVMHRCQTETDNVTVSVNLLMRVMEYHKENNIVDMAKRIRKLKLSGNQYKQVVSDLERLASQYRDLKKRSDIFVAATETYAKEVESRFHSEKAKLHFSIDNQQAVAQHIRQILPFAEASAKFAGDLIVEHNRVIRQLKFLSNSSIILQERIDAKLAVLPPETETRGVLQVVLGWRTSGKRQRYEKAKKEMTELSATIKKTAPVVTDHTNAMDNIEQELQKKNYSLVLLLEGQDAKHAMGKFFKASNALQKRCVEFQRLTRD